MIIESYDPELEAEATDQLDECIREHALALLKDDDGLVQEALSETIGYDSKASYWLRQAVRARIEGRHPELLPLAVRMLDLVTEYYLDVARTEYMQEKNYE